MSINSDLNLIVNVLSSHKFFTVPDFILLFFLLVIPLYSIVRHQQLIPDKPVAIVEISGKSKYQILLDQSKEIILNEWNPPVILQVEPGKIRILKNNCIRQICVQRGFIEEAGEIIVCIPKKILIYIRQNDNKNRANKIKAITG